MKFVIHFTTGSAWEQGQPHWKQGLVPHREYVREALAKGILIAGGPFMDHTGGLIILEVDNMAEAQDFADNDPAVIEKKFEAAIYPWEPLEGIFNQSS
ncbi:YciI family protein [Sporosarcina cyprini]|uniref:YciI family protein n=1 Tax=Sporosarcina cyprini TaxID=2910523 RepID=UPI001EE0B183|nr:YciI family protein [Sporosarcina cyprini]MCG3087205.1 YciI family protein [Sporosarcina cyprini]